MLLVISKQYYEYETMKDMHLVSLFSDSVVTCWGHLDAFNLTYPFPTKTNNTKTGLYQNSSFYIYNVFLINIIKKNYF